VKLPNSPQLNILIADDDLSMNKALSRLLCAAGHRVELAASGPEALFCFQRERFHLVITDYQMPGMRGDELAVAIKALAPSQPILMLTAYAEHLRSSSGSLCAVDMVIDKPCLAKELFGAIEKLLEKP